MYTATFRPARTAWSDSVSSGKDWKDGSGFKMSAVLPVKPCSIPKLTWQLPNTHAHAYVHIYHTHTCTHMYMHTDTHESRPKHIHTQICKQMCTHSHMCNAHMYINQDFLGCEIRGWPFAGAELSFMQIHEGSDCWWRKFP